MMNNFWKKSVFIGLILIAPLTAHAAPTTKTQAPKNAVPSKNAAPSLNDFPDIPRNHWAYVAMEKLGHANLSSWYSGNNRIPLPRTMTRFEAAVVTARALNKIGEIAPPDTPDFAHMSWSQAEREIITRMWLAQFDDSIEALCTEFSYEIRLLSVRDPIRHRGEEELFDPKTQAQQYGAFPPTPKNYWAYRAVLKMERAGLIPAFREIRGSDGWMRTRYEFAVATARALDALSDVPPVETLRLDRMSWKQIEHEIIARLWLSQFDADIAALKTEFAPELKRLNMRGGLETRIPIPRKEAPSTKGPSKMHPTPAPPTRFERAIDVGSKSPR